MSYKQSATEQYKQHLDEIVDNLPWEEFLDDYKYLTSPERGDHVSLEDLEDRYINGGFGNLFEKLDPIVFELGFRDWYMEIVEDEEEYTDEEFDQWYEGERSAFNDSICGKNVSWEVDEDEYTADENCREKCVAEIESSILHGETQGFFKDFSGQWWVENPSFEKTILGNNIQQ